MNSFRIKQAADRIEKATKALDWFDQYGARLGEKESASVKITLHFAGSCNGANEAAEALTAYAKFSLPDVLKAAVNGCRNDIDISRSQIEEELAK